MGIGKSILRKDEKNDYICSIISCTDSPSNAQNLFFGPDFCGMGNGVDGDYRACGRSIRPVHSPRQN